MPLRFLFKRIPEASIEERTLPTNGPYSFEWRKFLEGGPLLGVEKVRMETITTAIANEMLCTEEILEKAFKENKLPLRLGDVLYLKPGWFLKLRIRWALRRKKRRTP